MDRAVYLYLLYSLCAVSAVQGKCPVECQCEQLNQVQCQGKTITAFPKPIPPNTTYVYVAYTNISSLNPSDFEGFAETLRNLNVSHSGITEVSNGTFDKTRGLILLSLRETRLTGLPPQLFKHLRHLVRLLLDGNEITGVTRESFRGLGQLKSLDLSRNALADIQAGSFDDLLKLEQLSLQGNRIKRLPADLFSNLLKLKVLYLSRNELSALPAGIFDNLEALTKLSLFSNRLEGLPFGLFGPMPLEELWLYDNRLTSLEDDVFRGLTRLRLLVLSRNRISDVSVGAFRGLAALREVSLHTNRLSGLQEGTFGGLTALVNVSLKHNRLRSLPGKLLHGLPALRLLNLHNNSLPSLSGELLASLESADRVALALNPWACDRNIAPLRDWLRVHGSKVQNFSAIVCHSPPYLSGARVADLADHNLRPAARPRGLGDDTHLIATALVCTLVVAVLVGSICWRRRKETAFAPQLNPLDRDSETLTRL
ncbi:hypothetical protein AAFF_G00107770 [Aldrovandia affinis]|uniref:Uncharacterized protein n=1 Tax=Aldrovandia affinis TaxID=143900 RepID=A0AAD7RU67_9TELE|nr:hypothetical protein AAFF_G00107770 [Aldrovandia affinis]